MLYLLSIFVLDIPALNFDCIEGYGCRYGSRYNCLPKYGNVCNQGSLRLECDNVLKDGLNDTACLALLSDYCNADPFCKAFESHTQWSWGRYYPCSSEEEHQVSRYQYQGKSEEYHGSMMCVGRGIYIIISSITLIILQK